MHQSVAIQIGSHNKPSFKYQNAYFEQEFEKFTLAF